MNYFWGSLLMVVAIVLINRVSYWGKISHLGFASEVPLMFLKRPRAYEYFSYFLCLLCFLVSDIRWYVILPLFLIGLGAGNGQARKKQKEIVDEILAKDE